MPRVTATRTLNPLHFEDLEPHRFEDLVRQLAYEYRDWNVIEATGKGGADDGIDIRAFERQDSPVTPEDGDEEVSPALPGAGGRLWIFQCKRERRITPKQVERYVQESLQGEIPYGLILAAACDFSKKSYDAFRQTLVGTAVQEFQLWGKSELEDMLFQPKNDHLLFAYFGISLQVKKRGLQTEIRAKVAWRKRLLKALGAKRGEINADVLLVDVEDTAYPFIENATDFKNNPRWGIFRVKYLHPYDFLVLERRHQLAYVNPKSDEWDVLETSSIHTTFEMLHGQTHQDKHDPLAWPRRQAYEAYVPEECRAVHIAESTLLLSDILAIEEDGDLLHHLPILYIRAKSETKLVEDEEFYHLEVKRRYGGDKHIKLDPVKRVPFFKDFKEPMLEKKTDA